MTVPDWLERKAQEAENRLQAHRTSTTESGSLTEQIHATNADNLPTVIGYVGEVHMAKALVKAAHGLSTHQTRLIRYAVSKIHPTALQPPQLVVRITALEYAEEMQVKTSKNFYRDLHEAADGLFNRYISVVKETSKGRVTEKIHWVSSAKYHTGEGWVELRFSPEVSPWLSMLNQGDKIIYKLQSALELKSTYSWRLYELLMQWKDTNLLKIKLEEFRHALDVPESYRYTDIRAHCIEKSVIELREKAHIDVIWEAIKDKENRRKVSTLVFRWKSVD